MRENNQVWYVSYGSNLSYERFSYYIQGGYYKGNGRNYKGCKDRTMPIDWRPYMLPYEVYFGKNAQSWQNKGVAFLDTKIKTKLATFGRAYLITKEQFMDVWEQEGNTPDWYNCAVVLGELEGIPVITITRDTMPEYVQPDVSYVQVIKNGVRETFNYLDEEEVNIYIERILKFPK